MWWAFYGSRGDRTPFWQPLVGLALAALAVIAFTGFYAASRRIRAAVTATFVLVFLVLLTFALTIDEFAAALLRPGAAQLMNDFRWVLTTVIISYFGADAALNATKVWAHVKQGATPAQIRRADRDLVGGNR